MAIETVVGRRAWIYSHHVGRYSDAGTGFTFPIGIALAKDGVLFVANRGFDRIQVQRISKVTVGEEFITEFGRKGDDEGQFRYLTAVALDQEENVYAADEWLNRITVFDKDGSLLRPCPSRPAPASACMKSPPRSAKAAWRSLSSHRHPAGPDRRHQGAAGACRNRSRPEATVRARGSHSRSLEPSAHLHAPRHRKPGRRGLLGYGAPGGGDARGSTGARSTHRYRSDSFCTHTAVHARGAPPAQHGSSGRQAGEPLLDGARAQAPRFWARPSCAAGARRDEPGSDQSRWVGRDAPIHGTGSPPRPGGRPAR